MSCFTNKVGEDKYYCLDDYFGRHHYGYVKMTKQEQDSADPWNLLRFGELEGRSSEWYRKVLTADEFRVIVKREQKYWFYHPESECYWYWTMNDLEDSDGLSHEVCKYEEWQDESYARSMDTNAYGE